MGGGGIMSRLGQRLAKLEAASQGQRQGPEWLAVRNWLGEPLSEAEQTKLAEWVANKPPYDALAPVDTRGWSREAREWLGFMGPAQEFHVAAL